MPKRNEDCLTRFFQCPEQNCLSLNDYVDFRRRRISYTEIDIPFIGKASFPRLQPSHLIGGVIYPVKAILKNHRVKKSRLFGETLYVTFEGRLDEHMFSDFDLAKLTPDQRLDIKKNTRSLLTYTFRKPLERSKAKVEQGKLKEYYSSIFDLLEAENPGQTEVVFGAQKNKFYDSIEWIKKPGKRKFTL